MCTGVISSYPFDVEIPLIFSYLLTRVNIYDIGFLQPSGCGLALTYSCLLFCVLFRVFCALQGAGVVSCGSDSCSVAVVPPDNPNRYGVGWSLGLGFGWSSGLGFWLVLRVGVWLVGRAGVLVGR